MLSPTATSERQQTTADCGFSRVLATVINGTTGNNKSDNM